MNKIRKGDQVIVTTGRDKGKRGTVAERVDEQLLLVEGINVVKKHVKPNPQRNIKGGIAEQESTIHVSNVMLLDAEGNKTRVGSRVEGDERVRYSKASGNTIPEKKSKGK